MNTESTEITVSTPQLTQSQFVEHIKKWVILDNELKKTAERTKKLKEMRNLIYPPIQSFISSKNLTGKKIEISDGELCLCDKKEYSPLTYKYIEARLKEIIPDEDQVEYVIDYLKSHREIKTSQELRRTYKKEM